MLRTLGRTDGFRAATMLGGVAGAFAIDILPCSRPILRLPLICLRPSRQDNLQRWKLESRAAVDDETGSSQLQSDQKGRLRNVLSCGVGMVDTCLSKAREIDRNDTATKMPVSRTYSRSTCSPTNYSTPCPWLILRVRVNDLLSELRVGINPDLIVDCQLALLLYKS